MARSEPSGRVSLVGRVGISARDYLETSTFTILTIPEGVDPARVASAFRTARRHRTRGGLLVGLDVPVAVTSVLVIAPEVRLVYGGPARIGNKHRELGWGARATWRF